MVVQKETVMKYSKLEFIRLARLGLDDLEEEFGYSEEEEPLGLDIWITHWRLGMHFVERRESLNRMRGGGHGGSDDK